MFYSFFFFFFFLMIRRPPRSTLFPYTRSSDLVDAGQGVARRLGQQGRDENAQHRARKAARQDVDKDLVRQPAPQRRAPEHGQRGGHDALPDRDAQRIAPAQGRRQQGGQPEIRRAHV